MKAESDKRQASLTEAEKFAMKIANCDRFVASYDQVVANLKPQIDTLPASDFFRYPYLFVHPEHLARLNKEGVRVKDKLKHRFYLDLESPSELLKLIRVLERLVAAEKSFDPSKTAPKNDLSRFVKLDDIEQMLNSKVGEVGLDGLVTPRNAYVWKDLTQYRAEYNRDSESFRDFMVYRLTREHSDLTGEALINASALLAFQESLQYVWQYVPVISKRSDYSELPFMIGYGMIFGPSDESVKIINLLQPKFKIRQSALLDGGLSELYIKADTLMMTLALQYGALIRRNWME